MDLGRLLRLPTSKGKSQRLRIQKNGIVTVFGDGEKPAPLLRPTRHYVLSGNPVLQQAPLQGTDLTIFDLDPKIHSIGTRIIQDQLVAGYSKITSSFRLHSIRKTSRSYHEARHTAFCVPTSVRSLISEGKAGIDGAPLAR
jgi:hypothetical protein